MKRRIARGGERCRSGKKRYRDRQSAVTAMSNFRLRSSREVVPARAYDCEWCGGWHLTSQGLR